MIRPHCPHTFVDRHEDGIWRCANPSCRQLFTPVEEA